MAANVHYRIHESAVLSFNAPGQPVYEEVVWKTAQFTRDFGKLEAPVRTGRLRDSIRASRPRPNGVYQLASSISIAVKHGRWVHDGVPFRIYPKKGAYMTKWGLRGPYLLVPHTPGPLSGAQLKAQGGSGRGKLYFLAKNGVRGQDANPFLEQALQRALQANDVLQYRVG